MGSRADSLAMPPSPPKKGIDVPSSLPMRMPQTPGELEPPRSLFPPEAKPREPRSSKREAMADESLDLQVCPILRCAPLTRYIRQVPKAKALLLGAGPEPCRLEVRWAVPSPTAPGPGPDSLLLLLRSHGCAGCAHLTLQASHVPSAAHVGEVGRF